MERQANLTQRSKMELNLFLDQHRMRSTEIECDPRQKRRNGLCLKKTRAVNHRGVPSLSPVSPRRIWAAGTPLSNQGEPASSGEPDLAITTGMQDAPSDIAKRDEQISLLMAAMEESREREERMTQLLHDMQRKLNATETQQEMLSQKAQQDQLDLQQANTRLEESLKLERERTAAMLKEPSPKGRQDVVIYVANSDKTVQLNLQLSLRDNVNTVYTQCKEISAQKGIQWPKEEEYEFWVTGRSQEPVTIITRNVSLMDRGIRAQDLLMATLKRDRPKDISRANTPRVQRLLPITTVWGVTIKVWPANRGNAIMFRECTISMDATWRNVKEVIQKLLEIKGFIPPGDEGWTAKFWQKIIDDSWIDTKITEF